MTIKEINQRMDKVRNGELDEWFNSQFPQHPIIANIDAHFRALSNGLPSYFAKLKRLKRQSRKMLLFITQKELRYANCQHAI